MMIVPVVLEAPIIPVSLFSTSLASSTPSTVATIINRSLNQASSSMIPIIVIMMYPWKAY
jgi:hypothetical protein